MPPRKKAPAGPVPVESTRHADKRVNIPTSELSSFVAEDEKAPKTVLYPRDLSLDPQLVWKGKDQQDLAEYLSVVSVPVYIQEKIDPRALVENLRATADRPEDEPELRLFEDFDGLPFEELVEFYSHEGNWSNRMILGDALLVMNSLAEKEGLRGKVQMVYVDPPYGIKFGSNWQVSTRKREVRDRDVDVTRQPEQVKAFRDTWELGIHSYLSYLRDRLTVSRELLNDSGSCFVQIGDENVHLVRSLMDEVFGSENFLREIAVAKTAGLASNLIPAAVDYLLWYAKDADQVKARPLFRAKVDESGVDAVYRNVDEAGRIYRIDNLTSANNNVQSCIYEYRVGDRTYRLPPTAQWKTTEAGMRQLEIAGRLHAATGLYYKRYLDDFPVKPLNNLWADTGSGGFVEQKWYVVQTNAKIVARCVLMA